MSVEGGYVHLLVPGVLIQREHVAPVLYAVDRDHVAMLGGKHLVGHAAWQFVCLCVLRAVVPEHRHQHLT